MEYFLEPNEFFVGDHVQFYLCLPEGFTYKNFSIEKIKQTKSMAISDISIVKISGKDYIKLDFVAWEVGEIHFPSLKEIGINFELPSITVSSILDLDKTVALQEARPPLLLPGTTYLIYGYVFVFFIMCFLVAILAIWIRKKHESIINILSQRYAMFIFHFAVKRLKTKLKRQASKVSLQEIKSWIKNYEASFRLFLSSMYKNVNGWNSLTYNEIIKIIKEPNEEILNLLKLIFENISLIRFANVSDVNTIKKIIDYSFQLLKLYR